MTPSLASSLPAFGRRTSHDGARPAAATPERLTIFGDHKPLWLVRPICSVDVRIIMNTLGPTVDRLYPRGASLLARSLDDAVHRYVDAAVVVPAGRPGGRPLALACEKAKGAGRVKLSTFWVSPRVRGLGVGSALLQERYRWWELQGLHEVYGTIRERLLPEVAPLFRSHGFTHIHTEPNRYGDGADEAVLYCDGGVG